MSKPITPSRDIARLLEIMTALRTPVTGCPWDLEQTFESIAPYTIEEAYEVADAIQRGHMGDLRDELGDLLLQVVYHARMAEEQNAFDFGGVVDAVTSKMIRRHPHVFGTPSERLEGAAPGFWEKIKAEEKAQRQALAASLSHCPAHAARDVAQSRILGDVPVGLPALTRAIKLQDKAARVGFDWPTLAPVFDKLREEIEELAEAAVPADPRAMPPATAAEPAGGSGERSTAGTTAAITEEFGDVLFVMANIARHLGIDPEAALRGANRKFTRRFAYIEQRLAEDGRSPEQSTLEEMDAFWNEVRAADKLKTT